MTVTLPAVAQRIDSITMSLGLFTPLLNISVFVVIFTVLIDTLLRFSDVQK